MLEPFNCCLIVLEQLVVVDYQEGAGGEFLANFISAHWGQPLSTDPQRNPDHLQKWLNSHSLIKLDWDRNFATYLTEFVQLCDQHQVTKIAVPYHVYKWPRHLHILQESVPGVKFVKINSAGHEQALLVDYERKVSNRRLTSKDLAEIQFLLTDMDQSHKIFCAQKLKQGTLRLKDVRPDFKTDLEPKLLPSNDIEIFYRDLFVDEPSMSMAYQTLCDRLNLEYNPRLLQKLVQRNKKNSQDQTSYINSL